MKASTSKAGLDASVLAMDGTVAVLVDVELDGWWWWLTKGGASKPGTRRASLNGGGARDNTESAGAVSLDNFVTGVDFE